MSFRRPGKQRHKDATEWRAWKELHAGLIRASGLPPTVLRSRADWNYFLRNGYHCEPAYPHIDFNADEMSMEQTVALTMLMDLTLTKEEKQRGNALWPAGEV